MTHSGRFIMTSWLDAINLQCSWSWGRVDLDSNVDTIASCILTVSVDSFLCTSMFFSFNKILSLLLVSHSTQNKHRHLAPYHFYKQPKHLLSRFASKFHQSLDMKKTHVFGLGFLNTQTWQSDSSKRLLLPIVSGKFNNRYHHHSMSFAFLSPTNFFSDFTTRSWREFWWLRFLMRKVWMDYFFPPNQDFVGNVSQIV